MTHIKAQLLNFWNARVTVSQSFFFLERSHPVCRVRNQILKNRVWYCSGGEKGWVDLHLNDVLLNAWED